MCKRVRFFIISNFIYSFSFFLFFFDKVSSSTLVKKPFTVSVSFTRAEPNLTSETHTRAAAKVSVARLSYIKYVFCILYNVYSNAQSLKGVFNVIACIVCVCLCMLVLLKEVRNNRPFSINTFNVTLARQSLSSLGVFFWTKNTITRVFQKCFFWGIKRILPIESFNVLFSLFRDDVVCACVFFYCIVSEWIHFFEILDIIHWIL